MSEEKKQNNVEDIFSSTEKMHKESSVFKGLEPEELPEVEEISEITTAVPKKENKKNLIVIAIVTITILIFLGIYFFIPKIKNIREERKILEKEKIEKNAINQAIITEQLIDVDSDKDGLSDKEEVQFGSDFLKVDTDNDGLSDRDEVKVWQTDPLNPDSDGDKINDGDEIRKKLNPKGEGSLLETIKK